MCGNHKTLDSDNTVAEIKALINSLKIPGKHSKKFNPYINIINELTAFLPKTATLGEKLYCIKHDISSITYCAKCGIEIKFNPGRPGYTVYCSKSCAASGNIKPIKKFHCESCDQDFEQTQFIPNDQGKYNCPDCNKRIRNVFNRENYLNKKYNISIQDYENMKIAQDGKCAICKVQEYGRIDKDGNTTPLNVDHCHNTGKVRGLLCNSCNTTLGHLQDNPNQLISVIEYLSKHQEIPSWDQYFMNVARVTATRSKDPSTKVGSVIVKGKRIIATGYNGFPRGIEDKPEWLNDREMKYKLIIHAEMNAILIAQEYGLDMAECDIYCTLMPCFECAKSIAAVGIKSVKYMDDSNPRLQESFEMSRKLFDSRGILHNKVTIL